MDFIAFLNDSAVARAREPESQRAREPDVQSVEEKKEAAMSGLGLCVGKITWDSPRRPWDIVPKVWLKRAEKIRTGERKRKERNRTEEKKVA
jgi:hypothetical protein